MGQQLPHMPKAELGGSGGRCGHWTTGCQCPACHSGLTCCMRSLPAHRGPLGGFSAVAQLCMPVTFPRGAACRTPAAAPTALCRGEGIRTRRQLAPGSPTAATVQPRGRSRPRKGCCPPQCSGGLMVETATCPQPRQLHWPVALGMPSCQQSPLLPALVPEKPFAAQQVLGWVLEIPGTARDGPFGARSLSQHPPGATVRLWQHQPPLPQGPCPHQQQPLPVAQFWPQWACPRVWACRGWVGSRGRSRRAARCQHPVSDAGQSRTARGGALGFIWWRGPWWSLQWGR